MFDWYLSEFDVFKLFFQNSITSVNLLLDHNYDITEKVEEKKPELTKKASRQVFAIKPSPAVLNTSGEPNSPGTSGDEPTSAMPVPPEDTGEEEDRHKGPETGKGYTYISYIIFTSCNAPEVFFR